VSNCLQLSSEFWHKNHAVTLPYLTFGVNSLLNRLLIAEAILMLAQCA